MAPSPDGGRRAFLIPLPSDSRAWVEVDLGAIRHNIAALGAALGPEVRLLAVVKADAYGHGLVPVARAAIEAGAAWLGVATVAEGAALRAAGIDAPIALLCAPVPEEAAAILATGLTPAVGEQGLIEALGRAAQAAPRPAEPPAVHLEVDTGMGRSGALPDMAVDLWRAALDAGLRVTGLTTHFADADGEDLSLTQTQTAAFVRVRAALEAADARFEWVHLSNSAATLRLGAAEGNLVRPGLLIYGLRPPLSASSAQAVLAPEIRPALTLKARVATVRHLPAGHPISYGATCRLARPSRVATVLIGYGDGFPRRLSNCGHLLLRGRRALILGRVCMDQTVVDVTDIPNVAPGETAVCIGAQGAERLSVEEIAARIETTEHEITTGLTARLPRLYQGTNSEDTISTRG